MRAAWALKAAALAICLTALAAIPQAEAQTEYIGISLPFMYSPGNSAAAGKPATTWAISNLEDVDDAIVEVYNLDGLQTTLTIAPRTTNTFIYTSPFGDASTPSASMHTGLFLYWFRSEQDIIVSQFAAINGNSKVAEASTLLPTDSLGYSYVLPHYAEKDGTMMAIVAGADGATVRMTPAATIADGVYRTSMTCCPTDPKFPSAALGVLTTFKLGPYEHRRLDGWGDLSGSRVESDRPVALFSSSWCTQVAISACNHVEDVALPNHLVSTEYVGCAPSVGFNTYRVFATEAGPTDVTIDPVPVWPSLYRSSSMPGYTATGKGFTVTSTGVQLSGVGSWYQFDAGANVHIEATQDVTVSVVTGESKSTPYGDPSLLMPRPVNNWAPQYDFWVPDHDWVGRSVLVAGPAGAVASLDGAPFSLGSPVGASDFACQVVSVSPGQHRITSSENIYVSVMTDSTENRMWYAASGSFPPPPVADFKPTPGKPPSGPKGEYFPIDWTPDVACAGKPRTFDDLSVPGTGVLDRSLWKWGDATTSAYDPWTNFVTHTYLVPGTYTVELRVWNDSEAQDYVLKDVKVIDCNVPPVAEMVIAGGGTDCKDNRVHFFGDGSYDPDGGPVTFAWDFGDGTTATGNPVTHQFSTATPVTVTLTVTDDDGRSSVAAAPFPSPGDPNCPPDLLPLKDIVTTPGQSIEFPLSASDADGPKLDIKLFAGQPAGTLTTVPGISVATGLYKFTTIGMDTGTYTLTFEAFDGLSYDRESMRVHIRGLDSDVDRDGVQDAADNCPGTPNVEQSDADHDGVGDACEDAPPFVFEEKPEIRLGPGVRDLDRDGIQDGADNCVATANRDQADLDRDTEGDVCDADMDGDTVADKGDALFLDNCPTVPNPDQADLDGQGEGDACAGLLVGSVGRLTPKPASALDTAGNGGPSPWAWVGILVGVLGLAWAFKWRKRLVPALLVQFSRLTGRDALDHPVRSQISTLVHALPGIHQRELARRAGRSRRVVTYHLSVLLGHGVLQSAEVQGYTCYYPKGYPRAQLAESRVLRAPLAQLILEQVQQNPGQDATSMARVLGVSNKGLHYHIRRMEKAGLVRGERRGLVKQLYPNTVKTVA